MRTQVPGIVAFLITCAMMMSAQGCQSGPSPGHGSEGSAKLVGRPQRADQITTHARDEASGGTTGRACAKKPCTRWHRAQGASRARGKTVRRALWYQLLTNPRGLTVRMRLLHPPTRTSLFLPGAWAGRDDFANALTLGEARCQDGRRAVTHHRQLGRLDIPTKGCAWIELAYEVQLKQRRGVAQRFDPQRLDGGFFAYAPTFLILPSAQLSAQLRDIPVELRVPEPWTVVSTWKQIHNARSTQRPGDRVHGFMVEDVRALRDAFVAASPKLREHRVKAQRLRVVFAKGFRGDRAGITADIKKILDAYTRRFGAVGETAVLVRRADASAPLWGTGRHRGFVLEVDPRRHNREATRILIAHEAFHLWNGHELIPTPSQERATRWFKEGVTHYVGLRTLRQLNMISERTALAELAQIADRYQQHSVRPDAASVESYPYDRGVMIALMLDAALQQRGVSLDDWFTRLLAEARRSDDGVYYTQEALRGALLKVARNDVRIGQLWRRHVTAARPVVLRSLFKGLGLHWLAAERTRAARLVPLDVPRPPFRALFQTRPTAPAPRPAVKATDARHAQHPRSDARPHP